MITLIRCDNSDRTFCNALQAGHISCHDLQLEEDPSCDFIPSYSQTSLAVVLADQFAAYVYQTLIATKLAAPIAAASHIRINVDATAAAQVPSEKLDSSNAYFASVAGSATN